MTCDYIRVTYGWHASTYEWHTGDIRIHTSDIRITYEYVQVTYGWHTSTYEWHNDDIRVHTSDIRMTYEWYTSAYDLDANRIRNIKLYNEFGASKWLFLKTLLYAGAKDFWSLGCSYSHNFCWNIPKFNYRVWKLE